MDIVPATAQAVFHSVWNTETCPDLNQSKLILSQFRECPLANALSPDLAKR